MEEQPDIVTAGDLSPISKKPGWAKKAKAIEAEIRRKAAAFGESPSFRRYATAVLHERADQFFGWEKKNVSHGGQN